MKNPVMPKLPIINKPEFPNVPTMQGVPALKRPELALAATPVLAMQGSALRGGQSTEQWGVFDKSGKAIAEADTALSMDYNKENKVADFPIERGSFANYNKTVAPFELTVVLCKGGTTSELNAFISALEQWSDSTDCCDVITSSTIYLDANLVRLSYTREAASGVGMITATLGLQQIRQVDAQYTTVALPLNHVKSPDAASNVDQGRQQGRPVSSPSLLAKGAKGFKNIIGLKQ